MAKVYLVDSENIGSGWSQLLASMTDEDRMYVFYTDKSPYISYENLLQVIAYCSIPVFLKCYEGKNALDFQLVSELGFKLCETPDAEFIIVSDDYGYDPAAKYWSERGYNVCRIGKKLCKPALPKQNGRNEQTEVVAVQNSRTRRYRDRRNREVQAEELTQEEGLMAPEVAAEEAAAEESVAETVVEPAKDFGNGQMTETVAEVLPEETIGEACTEAQPAAEEITVVTEATAETKQEEPLEVEVPVTENAEQVSEEKADVQEVTEAVAEENKVAEELVAAEAIAAETVTVAEEAVAEGPEAETDQVNQKEGQSQKRSRERRKKNKKETVKENDKAVEEDAGYKLDLMLVDIARKSGSEEPEKDARYVKELFYTIKMSDLTNLNTALKILIGNEMGNDIYRELKEHTEYREQLDALYCPVLKNRFIHYVQIVLDRSGVTGVTADAIGSFLLDIPRKNLNSIRSAMIKEYGHENGAAYYTVLKAHIKVLNKI